MVSTKYWHLKSKEVRCKNLSEALMICKCPYDPVLFSALCLDKKPNPVETQYCTRLCQPEQNIQVCRKIAMIKISSHFCSMPEISPSINQWFTQSLSVRCRMSISASSYCGQIICHFLPFLTAVMNWRGTKLPANTTKVHKLKWTHSE